MERPLTSVNAVKGLACASNWPWPAVLKFHLPDGAQRSLNPSDEPPLFIIARLDERMRRDDFSRFGESHH